MAQYNNDRYADPYQQQNQYANYDQQPYGYSNDTPHNYDQAAPNYSTPDVHTLSQSQSHQHPDDYYTSTDKINENSAIPAGAEDYTVPVERERKGRQGAGGNSKSWAQGPPPRSTGILRMWRKDERGKQWTRGGGCRFAMRMCCCCLTLGIIIALSIILTIALYIRPPNVILNNINVPNGAVALSSTGLNIAFSVSLSVANPNWFSVNFRKIDASVTYPGVEGSDLGGGSLNNVNFAGYTQSTFNFPLAFNYTLASDPNRVIINDLATKCGPSGSDIRINYKLDLDLRVLGVSVKPTFSDTASFECPISSSDIEGIIGGVGT